MLFSMLGQGAPGLGDLWTHGTHVARMVYMLGLNVLHDKLETGSSRMVLYDKIKSMAPLHPNFKLCVDSSSSKIYI